MHNNMLLTYRNKKHNLYDYNIIPTLILYHLVSFKMDAMNLADDNILYKLFVCIKIFD